MDIHLHESQHRNYNQLVGLFHYDEIFFKSILCIAPVRLHY